MSIAGLLTLSCTITARDGSGTVDAYGDETSTSTSTVTVCELQQQQRSETSDPGEIAASSWLLVLPAGTSIRAGDTATVGGDEYELVGEPWEVRHPRLQTVLHIECTVRRAVGVEGS